MLINYRKRYLQFQLIWTSTLVIDTFGVCLNDEFYDFLLLWNDLTVFLLPRKREQNWLLFCWNGFRIESQLINSFVAFQKKKIYFVKCMQNLLKCVRIQYFEILFSTIHLLQCTYRHAYKPDTTLQLIKKSRRQI